MNALADNLARKYGGCDQEDLAQELKVLAWKERDQHPFALNKKLKWRAMDYYRKERNRRARFFELNEAVADPPAPESYLDEIQKLIGEIPEGLKNIFLLRAYGFTVEEIADKLDCAPSIAFKKLDKLRDILIT